jgi:hypothetical protein
LHDGTETTVGNGETLVGKTETTTVGTSVNGK